MPFGAQKSRLIYRIAGRETVRHIHLLGKIYCIIPPIAAPVAVFKGIPAHKRPLVNKNNSIDKARFL